MIQAKDSKDLEESQSHIESKKIYIPFTGVFSLQVGTDGSLIVCSYEMRSFYLRQLSANGNQLKRINLRTCFKPQYCMLGSNVIIFVEGTNARLQVWNIETDELEEHLLDRKISSNAKLHLFEETGIICVAEMKNKQRIELLYYKIGNNMKLLQVLAKELEIKHERIKLIKMNDKSKLALVSRDYCSAQHKQKKLTIQIFQLIQVQCNQINQYKYVLEQQLLFINVSPLLSNLSSKDHQVRISHLGQAAQHILHIHFQLSSNQLAINAQYNLQNCILSQISWNNQNNKQKQMIFNSNTYQSIKVPQTCSAYFILPFNLEYRVFGKLVLQHQFSYILGPNHICCYSIDSNTNQMVIRIWNISHWRMANLYAADFLQALMCNCDDDLIEKVTNMLESHHQIQLLQQ